MNDRLPSSCETLIVGAGVVGLSIAYELAQRGCKEVVLVDRQPPALEASWAGAGILPPGSWYVSNPALEALAALSVRLNYAWSKQLLVESGIDDLLRTTGAVHLASTPQQFDHLKSKFAEWSLLGIETTAMEPQEVADIEPGLCVDGLLGAYLVPGEAQIDNRLHAAALVEALKRRGILIYYPHQVNALSSHSPGGVTATTTGGQIHAQRVVLTAGAWTPPLAEQLGVALEIRPIRGQMLDFEPLADLPLTRIIHQAGQYLVPRAEGRVIVGATVEEVGFDKSTDRHQIEGLAEFARRTLPALADQPIDQCWAGLRPASADDLPYIGPVPGAHNVFIAAGHYRSGLQMASGTAVMMADLLAGGSPPIDITPFSLQR